MYVDGCVFAVPTARKAEFTSFSKAACAVFREQGVLEAAMTDPRLTGERFKTLVDGKRMIFGGFTPVNQA